MHNELSGTTHGPVVMGRDFHGPINIKSSLGSRTATALDEAAAELAQALRKQWSTESERQRLLGPDTLAIGWQTIRSSPEAGPLPPTGELQGISSLYDQVPTGRLVVLGRAGSGKSALAIRFVLDRLRSPHAPVHTPIVPVIFSLGSWNPETPLEDWLARQLERDHPGLAADGPDNRTLAKALVAHRRILPVLDGFDEITEALRPSALDKLSDTASSRMPLLLTSRGHEYEETGVLVGAAEIKLRDLSPADLTEYLSHTSPAQAAAWNDVLERLRDAPEGPAATALRTPLMVALARTVYSAAPDRNPSELLSDRFPTAEDVENHLLDSFIPTVYRDKPAAYRERVQHWLAHLAHHLKRLDTPDLKWWQLGSTLRRPVRTAVVGLVSGLVFGLVSGLAMWYWNGVVLGKGLVGGLVTGLANGAVLGLVSGLAFGLLYGLTDGGAAREPSHVRMRFFGGTLRSRKLYVPRLAAGAAGGFGFGFISWLVKALVFGLLEGGPTATVLLGGLLNGLVGGLVGGLLLGFAYAGGAGEPSDEPPRFADGMREFRQRIAPRLAIGAAGGLGVGFAFWFVSTLASDLVLRPPGGFTSLLTRSLRLGIEGGLGYGLGAGFVYGLVVALADPIPISSAVSPAHLLKRDRIAVLHRSLVSTLVFGLVGLLFYGSHGLFLDWLVFTAVGSLGFGIAYGLGLTAWGHWVTLARIWLPLTGRLPRDLGAFLEDAHRRGVLRQAGGVYQFRYAGLQDRLAYAQRPDQHPRRFARASRDRTARPPRLHRRRRLRR